MFSQIFFAEAREHVQKSFDEAFIYNQLNGPITAIGRATADECFRI